VIRSARARGLLQVVVLVEHQPIVHRGRGDDVRSLVGAAIGDAVVVLSEDYRRRYRFRSLAERRGRPLAVIPNGVDVHRFRPAGPQSEQPDGRLRIGMMGRMVPTKDFAGLLHAISLLAEGTRDRLTLRLAGDGTERERLERLCHELDIDSVVSFTGTLGEPQLVEFLADLDVYVHATFGETASTALLQACAMGLPVIASDVPGVHDLVRGGTDAVLVPPGSAQALATALQAVLDDPARRASLGEAARARAVSCFGADLMSERYLQVLTREDPSGPWRGR
jgi:glycosyltransferase involved in cell wall biosynthesis